MITRWILIVGVLLPGIVEASVVERAKTATRTRPRVPEEQLAHARTLIAYADSTAHEDVVVAARCLEVAGILRFQARELDAAIDVWRRGVDFAREQDSAPAEASLLNALAIGFSVAGRQEEAFPVYERALELRTALADTLGLSRTWGNLANAYADLGRTAESLEATVRAEAWLARVDNRVGMVSNAIRRARLLNLLQRRDEALLWSERGVDLATALEDPRSLGMAAFRHGDVLLDAGRPAEALEWLDRALATQRSAGEHGSAMFTAQTRVVCLIELGRFEEALDEATSQMAIAEDAGHDPLWTALARMRATCLFELGHADEAETVLREALVRFEERVRAQSDARSRIGAFEASGEVYASLARCLLARDEVVAAFDMVERGRAPAFRASAWNPTVDRARLQQILGAQDAALVLFNDPRFDPLVAFVATADGIESVPLGSIDALVADADAALRLLAAGQTLERCRPALRRMEEALAQPVLDAIPPDARRVYLVPPSSLVGFPFGLLDGRDGIAWGRRHALGYLPNAGALLDLAERTPHDGEPVAFADPPAAGPSAGRLPVSPARGRARAPLPEARREIEVVTSRPGHRLVGADASVGALRSERARSASVLHLATHAVVDPIDGRRSALVLAAGEDVATLDAAALRDFDLNNDLVVLSGCSTFGTDRALGEGWLGLPRSILDAGARSVVSTLWDVDDRGARQVVENFYAQLREGRPRDEALAAAKADAHDAGLPPREWAGFVLTGLGGEAVRGVATADDGRRPWVLGALVLTGLLGVARLGLRPRRR